MFISKISQPPLLTVSENMYRRKIRHLGAVGQRVRWLWLPVSWRLNSTRETENTGLLGGEWAGLLHRVVCGKAGLKSGSALKTGRGGAWAPALETPLILNFRWLQWVDFGFLPPCTNTLCSREKESYNSTSSLRFKRVMWRKKWRVTTSTQIVIYFFFLVILLLYLNDTSPRHSALPPLTLRELTPRKC